MKKAVPLISFLLVGCMAAFYLTACGDGNGDSAGDDPVPTASLTYEKNGNAYTVTGETENVANIVIPAEHEGLAVTAIQESAFAYSRHNADILSVTIPDSVTTIGRNAFYNRDELVTVNIGQNSRLSAIENNAFSGNSSLKSIYIPTGVQSIGDGAFNNDGKINFSVSADNAVYRSENGHLIEKATDTLIRGGQSSVVPESVTAIAQAAFRRSALTEIFIPLTVLTIENYVIADSAITAVNFAGTEEEWSGIAKSTMWDFGSDARIVYGMAASDILIAYFSWSGTTMRLAQHVQSGLPNATAYRIERETPYSDDYNTVAYGEAKEEADANARPPVKNPLTANEMKRYRKVIVMYPIWWHTAPMVVGTFLETYDLSGVDVYPITQSASMSVSQFNESFAFIGTCANKNGTPTVHTGLGTKSTAEIDEYLKMNGLIA